MKLNLIYKLLVFFQITGFNKVEGTLDNCQESRDFLNSGLDVNFIASFLYELRELNRRTLDPNKLKKWIDRIDDILKDNILDKNLINLIRKKIIDKFMESFLIYDEFKKKDLNFLEIMFDENEYIKKND